MKQCADPELIAMIRESNSLAFDELHARYWHKLFGIANKKIGDPDEADDLIQEFFIEIWEKRATLDFNNSVDSWLRNRLWYKIAGYFRTKGFKEKHLESIREFLSRKPAAPSPMELIELKNANTDYEEILKVISSGIEEMPARMKEIFQLHISGALTQKQIAEKLNVAPTTVKTQLERATQKLKKIASEHPGSSLEYLLLFWLINY